MTPIDIFIKCTGINIDEVAFNDFLSMYENSRWRTGTAPGTTWLLVKDKWERTHVAKLEANPCVWVDRWEHIIEGVTAWRAL